MKDKLVKGIILIFIANVINMIFNILTNFLLPKYLSMNAYADIKTFQLCLTYIGVLHFGFNDGMYLKYGGKNFNEIDTKDLGVNFNTIQMFQTLVLFLGVVFGIVIQSKMVLFASAVLLPYNMMNYCKSLYQACGEFKAYGRVLNASTAGIFFINILFLFMLRIEDSSFYILGYIILYYLIWVWLISSISKKIDIKFKIKYFKLIELKENIQQGILLMLGNFSSTFITSMDRWFVKIFLDTVSFAQYSFAVSMENFLNIAITPLTTSLYNYFCKDSSVDTIAQVRKKTIIFACALITAAFPVKLFLQIYLPKYVESERVLFLLFASQAFYVVNKSVYNNLYKAKKLQNKYFRNLFITIIVAFAFNIIGYMLLHIKEGFAWGTLFASIVWLFIVTLDFKDYRCNINEIIMLVVSVSAFLIYGNNFNVYVGCALYILTYIIAAFTIMRRPIMSLLQNGIDYLKNKKGE